MNIDAIRIDEALVDSTIPDVLKLPPLSFSLTDHQGTAPYPLRSVFGLDAESVRHDAVNYNAIYQQSYFVSTGSGREIVIRFLVNPDMSLGQSKSALRDAVYRKVMNFINNKVYVVLVENGVDQAQIEGQITKVEVPLFSETSEAQITISCRTSLFVAKNPIRVPGVSQPGSKDFTIPYTKGNAPAGWKIELQNTAPAGTIFNGFGMDFRHVGSSYTTAWGHLHAPSSVGYVEPGVAAYVANFSETKRSVGSVSLTYGNKNLMNYVEIGSIFPLLIPGRGLRVAPYLYINDYSYSIYHRITHVDYWPAYWGV